MASPCATLSFRATGICWLSSREALELVVRPADLPGAAQLLTGRGSRVQ